MIYITTYLDHDGGMMSLGSEEIAKLSLRNKPGLAVVFLCFLYSSCRSLVGDRTLVPHILGLAHTLQMEESTCWKG